MVFLGDRPNLHGIRAKAEEITFEYYQSGFTCAEAISKAVLEIFHPKPYPIVPKIASAFSGGLGQSHEELCGAFTGGIIVLSCLFGRSGLDDGLDDSFQ